MKDFHGTQLKIADIVTFCRPQYRDLTEGKVIKFTPQKVKVEYRVHYGDNIFYTYLAEPTMLVRSPEEKQDPLSERWCPPYKKVI